MEQKKISDSINIALKKIHGQLVTASQVKSNSQDFQNLLLQDQAYLFLQQIPGSPPYWQKFMYEVVAMVKQLGIPTCFGQFFTDKTIVAEPLAEDMDEEIKSNILTRRKEILSKQTYYPFATPTDILNDIDITEQDYQWAISLSPDSDYELHLKRPINSCFINNYFIAGLKGFAANVDLQPVFKNHYKCITYVCSYFIKDETECSQAIINAAKEAKEANVNVRDGLSQYVQLFSRLVNTDFAENRVRFAKKQQELDELDDDSTDIFKSNIIVRYSDRPKNIPVIKDMCLALFAAHYFKDYKSDFNEVSDSQPEVLNDDFMESQNIENHNTGLPDRIKLKLFGEDQTYISKFYEPDVQEVVKRNKEIFEPDGDAINKALETLRKDGVPTHSYDPINQQENEYLRQSLPDDSDETESFNESLPQNLASNPESVQPSSGISSYNRPISDDNLRKTVRSLNNKQRYAYERLKEIFVTPNSELFAGISLLVFGDFFQLPPIRSATTFSNYKNDTFNLHQPWHVFKMAELTQIMRQKDDLAFTQLLNRVRSSSHTDDDIKCIQSSTISPDDENYPFDALHIFAENSLVDEYNIDRLQQIQSPQYVLEALDQFPPHVRKQDIDRVLSKGRSETGGLDTKILIKENARVMLTTNVDISDRLINGQLGTVIKVSGDNVSNKLSTIFVKFDDSNAGVSAIRNSSSSFARENNVVPIKPVLARMKVYVALSRATSLNGLHILGTLESKHIRANPKVQEEYERLRETSSLHPHITTDLCDIETVSICLLNIRSLKKHSHDLCNDSVLSKCDVFALTETQLLTSLPVEIMKSTDNETVIKLSKFISFCFEKRSKCLETMNADSQQVI
ncbi:Hypothetical predicted protein [Paramuricea clavata]|uniref:Uncharacterized protein n=1 Tax=Paramuricea clavata TaxID=317549 RepID=A0A7D9HXT5_PARCT|nr:Hypothetical predicted protein [Paramuricea clavata]